MTGFLNEKNAKHSHTQGSVLEKEEPALQQQKR